MAMATTSLLFLAFSTTPSAHFMFVSCSSTPATRSFQPLHAVAFFSSTALASTAAATALAFPSSVPRITPAARGREATFMDSCVRKGLGIFVREAKWICWEAIAMEVKKGRKNACYVW
ncbi:hypothetical protein CFC21_100096 [Triticum aestivum]|uniref:Secreted protein n=3 Tax=Triticum TaxID=4564 RepID=A0A9R1BTL2_TRITD|nr:hypothetical protein CFC21_100096 [Triticum aestivum]VAI80579.1 unnamed protein product [Triticum turgidum subsp. durum]